MKTKENKEADELAQEKADMMNAKILEAAQRQQVSAAAVVRIQKGKQQKGGKKQ